MSEGLYRLVYCSRSSFASEAGQAKIRDELLSILDAARANNRRFGVTGALLFSDGCFAQALEGSLAAIERTFERIQRDARHHDVTVLQVEAVSQRLFGEWSMAFAGNPAGAHPLAAMTVDRAFSSAPTKAGREVIGLLQRLVTAEENWISAAA